jgi:hypothetical protein
MNRFAMCLPFLRLSLTRCLQEWQQVRDKARPRTGNGSSGFTRDAVAGGQPGTCAYRDQDDGPSADYALSGSQPCTGRMAATGPSLCGWRINRMFSPNGLLDLAATPKDTVFISIAA